MPVPVALHGTWVDPAGTPRTGRILARRADPHRAGGSVWTGTTARPLDAGTLPSSGDGALRVTAPDAGTWDYDITERLDGLPEVTYRIHVSAADTAAGVDLTSHG